MGEGRVSRPSFFSLGSRYKTHPKPPISPIVTRTALRPNVSIHGRVPAPAVRRREFASCSITGKQAARRRRCTTSSIRRWITCWSRRRRGRRPRAALALFRDVVAQVPAYGAFLKENGIAAQSIRTWRISTGCR